MKNMKKKIANLNFFAAYKNIIKIKLGFKYK